MSPAGRRCATARSGGSCWRACRWRGLSSARCSTVENAAWLPSLLVAAVACYAASAASYFGFVPATRAATSNRWSPARRCSLGHWLLLVGSRVLRPVRRARCPRADRRAATRRPQSKTSRASKRNASEAAVGTSQRRRADTSCPQSATRGVSIRVDAADEVASRLDRWVDGSRPEREPYE